MHETSSHNMKIIKMLPIPHLLANSEQPNQHNSIMIMIQPKNMRLQKKQKNWQENWEDKAENYSLDNKKK